MPQKVYVPELNKNFVFPDEATQEQIKKRLRKERDESPILPSAIKSRISKIQARKDIPQNKKNLEIQRELAQGILEQPSVKGALKVAETATLFALPGVNVGSLTTRAGLKAFTTSAAKLGLASSGLKFMDEALEKGKPVAEAGAEALKKSLSDVLTSTGVGVGFRAAKAGIKGAAKALSRVEGSVVEEAIENPKILKGEALDVSDIAENIEKGIREVQENASSIYKKSLEAIGMKGSTKRVVPTKKAIDKLIERNRDVEGVASRMKAIARAQRRKLSSPTLLDRFIKGEKLTFDEADEVSQIMRNFDNLGKEQKELKSAISQSRKLLVNSIEENAPGTKAMKKTYAESQKLIDDLSRRFGTEAERIAEKESALTAIGKKAIGKKAAREADLKKIMRLDKKVGTDIVQQLKKRAVDEAFSEAGDDFVQALKETSGFRPFGKLGAGETITRLGTKVAAPVVSGLGGLQPVVQRGIQAGIAGPEPIFQEPSRSLNEIMFGPKK